MIALGGSPATITVLDEPRTAPVGRPERVRGSEELWRDAVFAGLAASNEVKRQVNEFCIDMPDRAMSEVVARLNELFQYIDFYCSLLG